MKIHDCIQGSEQWENLRKGRPTASRFSDIVTAAKGDLSKSSKSYIAELIGETFCPDFIYWSGNAATDRGQELEDEAREAFRQMTQCYVRKVGFVTRDDMIVGCSPDGFIYDFETETPVAGVEIKCPSPKVHIGYVMDGVLPDQYKQQVHGGLAVTGLKEWHFFSWFPGLKPFHIVVTPDDYTHKLSASLDQFLIDYRAAREAVIPKIKLQ